MMNKLFNESAACNKGHNDFLDDMLDGKPVMIVDSPQLRRSLRRRARERALEELDQFNPFTMFGLDRRR